MSRAAQLAREEADAVEAAEREAETEAAALEDNAEAAPEPAEPRDMAEVMAEVMEANADHLARLLVILGDEAQHFTPCPTCGDGPLGVIPPGQEPMLPPAEVPGLVRCPTCRGHGFRTTPSLAPGHDTRLCTDCGATGVAEVAQLERNRLAAEAAANLATMPPPGIFVGVPEQPADPWGRPAGHPHYGINPAAIGV